MPASSRQTKNFPCFLALPKENELDPSFYRSSGFSYEPRRHWCLLAEIEEVEAFIRVRLVLRDSKGHRFPLAFYLDNDDEQNVLRSMRFVRGNTVAVLYATQHQFLDMTVGVRQEDLMTVKILPMSLETVLQLSDKLQDQAKTDGDGKCKTCKEPSDSLKKCNACKLTNYCSKECQAKDWNTADDGHKANCKQLRHLTELVQINWNRFEDFHKFANGTT